MFPERQLLRKNARLAWLRQPSPGGGERGNNGGPKVKNKAIGFKESNGESRNKRNKANNQESDVGHSNVEEDRSLEDRPRETGGERKFKKPSKRSHPPPPQKRKALILEGGR